MTDYAMCFSTTETRSADARRAASMNLLIANKVRLFSFEAVSEGTVEMRHVL